MLRQGLVDDEQVGLEEYERVGGGPGGIGITDEPLGIEPGVAKPLDATAGARAGRPAGWVDIRCPVAEPRAQRGGDDENLGTRTHQRVDYLRQVGAIACDQDEDTMRLGAHARTASENAKRFEPGALAIIVPQSATSEPSTKSDARPSGSVQLPMSPVA